MKPPQQTWSIGSSRDKRDFGSLFSLRPGGAVVGIRLRSPKRRVSAGMPVGKLFGSSGGQIPRVTYARAACLDDLKVEGKPRANVDLLIINDGQAPMRDWLSSFPI